MVAPLAFDQEELVGAAEFREAVSLEDALRRDVVRLRAGFEAVQLRLAERERDDIRKCASREAATVVPPVDPVADVREL